MALIGPWRLLAPAVCLLTVVLTACVSNQETAQTGNIQAVVVSSDLAVGQNRFVLGLLRHRCGRSCRASALLAMVRTLKLRLGQT